MSYICLLNGSTLGKKYNLSWTTPTAGVGRLTTLVYDWRTAGKELGEGTHKIKTITFLLVVERWWMETPSWRAPTRYQGRGSPP